MRGGGGGGGGGGGSLLLRKLFGLNYTCFNINLSAPTSALSKQFRANRSYQSPTLSLLVPATPIYDPPPPPPPTPKLSQLSQLPPKKPPQPHTHTHTHTFSLHFPPPPLVKLCHICPIKPGFWLCSWKLWRRASAMASEELRFWVVRPANLPEEAEDWVGWGVSVGF